MSAFWKAFILIFMAELGDKTQFMTLAMATKYKALDVMLGVTIGTTLVSLLSVALGSTVGRILPMFWIAMLAGVAFITFGLLELKGDSESEIEEAEEKVLELSNDQGPSSKKGLRFGPILTIAGTFFLAELGDKTMLATVAIASREGAFIQVWLGSSLGLVASNALAIFAGKAVGTKVSANTLRYVISAVYIISGILSIVEGFKHKL
ncbi:MAG: TMEM165/GDT1 family protein [Candidatus Obscuribacterales bacterium]|nr:TMEM165/GDT1 family protein [Candidatus Obscuribacterales bacterium]